MSEEHEHLKDEGSKQQVVVAGAFAGLVSRFCIAPLDVIKIRLQLQVRPSVSQPAQHQLGSPNLPHYKGAIQTFKHIVKEEGIRSLWKGNIPAELLYLFYGGIQFSTYRSSAVLLHSFQPRIPDFAESFISGAVAGAVATTATYPLDLLRTRFAAQGTERVYASLLASVRDIYRHEGVRGYLQGLGAGLGQIVPYMGLFFAAYEALRAPVAAAAASASSSGGYLPLGSSDAASGFLAGVVAKTGVFPLDLVRKRLQVQGPTRARYVYGDLPVYEGVWSALREILRLEGPRGLYRGLTVSLVKAAPTSAVTMWVYERALKVLIELERERERKRDR